MDALRGGAVVIWLAQLLPLAVAAASAYPGKAPWEDAKDVKDAKDIRTELI